MSYFFDLTQSEILFRVVERDIDENVFEIKKINKNSHVNIKINSRSFAKKKFRVDV